MRSTAEGEKVRRNGRGRVQRQVHGTWSSPHFQCQLTIETQALPITRCVSHCDWCKECLVLGLFLIEEKSFFCKQKRSIDMSRNPERTFFLFALLLLPFARIVVVGQVDVFCSGHFTRAIVCTACCCALTLLHAQKTIRLHVRVGVVCKSIKY